MSPFRGLKNKVLSAKVLKTGQALTVTQDGFRTHITGLPDTAPDTPVTIIAIECDGVPMQDTQNVRINSPRRALAYNEKAPVATPGLLL